MLFPPLENCESGGGNGKEEAFGEEDKRDIEVAFGGKAEPAGGWSQCMLLAVEGT